mgnify:CR=1 FL=1
MTDLKKRLFAGLLALVLLCAPLSGCAAREAERYDVLASTAPVRAMTAALLEGTGLNCGLVVTESVSCLHDYTLTVAQMEKIGQADVVVLNGLGLEEFMEDALRTAKRTITASTGVDTLPGEDGEDPHIWLDPANCILMCKNIAAGLAEFYPDKQPLIEQNLSAVTAEYEAAQTYGEETLKALSCRELVTFHDGFSYFADAFDLTIAAAMEVESGSEPSAKELEAIIAIVEEDQIPAVFYETNGEAGSAEVVANETGCSVWTLDMAISSGDYFAAMRENIDIVKEALG